MSRVAWSTFGKELRTYGTTWPPWVLGAAFLELTAFLFTLLVQDFQARRLRHLENRAVAVLEQMNLTEFVVGPMLSYVATFFVFLLPVLTMRALVAERREGTWELVVSTGARPAGVILGKYAAAWTVMATMLASTLVFPVALQAWAGEIQNALDWPTIGAGYFGMLLLGSAGVAVGLWASAMADSQLTAAVLGFGVLFALMGIGMAAETQPDPLRTTLEHLSLSHPMADFSRGLLRLSGIAYYLSVAGVALVLCHRRMIRGAAGP